MDHCGRGSPTSVEAVVEVVALAELAAETLVGGRYLATGGGARCGGGAWRMHNNAAAPPRREIRFEHICGWEALNPKM